MRLVMFGEKGRERPGLLREDCIVDLEKAYPGIPAIGETFFEEGWLAKVAGCDLPGDKVDVRLGSPVPVPSKIICLGKNYAEHAKEGGFDNPASPPDFL